MPGQNDPLPNVPDIRPDYVDSRPKAAPAAPPPVSAPVSDAPPTPHRDGECVPNVPDVAPDLVGEQTIRVVPSRPAEPEAESTGGFAVPRWLRWGYFGVTLLVAALFGVFLFSQTISSLALARTLPEWAQYLLLIPLAFCAAVLLGVCVSLAWSWLRLRSFRQINLAAIEELRRRAESRKDGQERFQAARQYLEGYLREYPLVGRGAAALSGAGLSDEALEQLFRERDHLLGLATDSADWLADFRRLFQNRLDRAAAGKVNSWALKAAGCVMASPLPLLDAILVLTISLRMIRDLCTLYNIRTGAGASWLLLWRAIRNAFIAGLADDASEAVGDFAGDQVSELLGQGAFGTVSSSVARVVAPKLGEGAINGLFMRRLGKATIRMLQPLAAK